MGILQISGSAPLVDGVYSPLFPPKTILTSPPLELLFLIKFQHNSTWVLRKHIKKIYMKGLSGLYDLYTPPTTGGAMGIWVT